MNILGAHIDSPRIDVKQNPLYETEGYAYLDTHYYGGIRKYQWLTIPLAIHGVICKTDGTTVTVSIGEENLKAVLSGMRKLVTDGSVRGAFRDCVSLQSVALPARWRRRSALSRSSPWLRSRALRCGGDGATVLRGWPFVATAKDGRCSWGGRTSSGWTRCDGWQRSRAYIHISPIRRSARLTYGRGAGMCSCRR